VKNLIGYKPLTNPEWIVLQFEDGSESTPVNDPAGEYRAEVDSIAKKIAGVPPDPMQGATASLGGEIAEGAGTAMSRADVPMPSPSVYQPPAPRVPAAGPAQPAADGDAGKIAHALGRRMGGALGRAEEQGMPAGGEAAPMQPQQPMQLEPPVGPPQLVKTGSTNQWQETRSEGTQTSGLSEADRPGVQKAYDESIDARQKAGEAEYTARATQGWNEWTRLTGQERKKLAERAVVEEQERAMNEKVEAAYKKLDETAARPIDPSQAFAGEKGWYAFMAGFGDVIRNVGSALAGQRPVADPMATLDSMVQRSVDIQMAQKKADYDAGRISIDRLNADRETIRHKVSATVKQLAEIELGKAQTRNEYNALGAVLQKANADVADARAKAATSLARSEVKTDQTSKVRGGSTTTGIVGGSDPSKLLDYEKKALELKNAYREQESADKASQIIRKPISPDQLKTMQQQRASMDPKLTKVEQLKTAFEQQLAINGATVDWRTLKVHWPKDLAGVSAVKARDLGGPMDLLGVGAGLETMTNAKAKQLDESQRFFSELITTDTTGAVASLGQVPVFKEAAGGVDPRDEAGYKNRLERMLGHIGAAENSIISKLGEDGAKLYIHERDAVRNMNSAPNANVVGTLPEGMR
jgi:hypothetical protein